METEETNGGEFQAKIGLKRKLTGPPRLLLGKTKSPAQDEKSDAHALRKQRRDKNNGTPKHMAEEHQGNNDADCESQQVMCQSPPTGLTVEEEDTQTELQEESLETKSAKISVETQHGKSRRCRAKATIRRVFSPVFLCIRRKKQLDSKYLEHPEDDEAPNFQDTVTNDETTHERLTVSGDTFTFRTDRCEDPLKKSDTCKRKRKFHIRIWPIFKRLTVTSNSTQRGKACTRQSNDTFIEITSEKDVEKNSSAVDQSDYCTPEPSGHKAVEEQLNGSSELHEEMARIHEESCPGRDLGQKDEGTEIVLLNAEVRVDLDTMCSHEKVEQLCCSEQDKCQKHQLNIQDEEDIMIQTIEIPEPTTLLDSSSTSASVNECKVPITNVAVLNDLDMIVPIQNEVKCQPVIMIEDVEDDEETQEAMVNEAPQQGTLSPLLSLNGSCHHFKVKTASKNTLHTLDQSDHSSQFSEILLVQTAFSLVSAAISSAMEQISAELQSNQIDQDHAL